MTNTKTLAFQIPEELDLRIKNYLAVEKERTGKKLSQKDFVVGLIQRALDEYDAADKQGEYLHRRPSGIVPAANFLLEESL